MDILTRGMNTRPINHVKVLQELVEMYCNYTCRTRIIITTTSNVRCGTTLIDGSITLSDLDNLGFYLHSAKERDYDKWIIDSSATEYDV